MILRDGFLWIPLLPAEMRERLKTLPANKKQWPKDFRDRYASLHREFTAAKAEFYAFARKDRDPRISPRARMALSYLVDCLNFDTGRCDPSQQTIADEIGSCTRTAERMVRQLHDAGWIEVYRRGKTATNFYKLRVSKAKIDAICEDNFARRELRKRRQKELFVDELPPAKMSDHSVEDTAEMSDHPPVDLSCHETTEITDKPMNRTSEAEPLNENNITVAREGTYTGEDIPSDANHFSKWIEENIPDRSQHREAYRLLRERKMTPELWRRMAA